jgi:S-adenosylmethionine decarboxylase
MLHTAQLKNTKSSSLVDEVIEIEPIPSFEEQTSKLSRHCLATVVVIDPDVLTDSPSFIKALTEILEKEQVQCVGYVNHDFDNNSFTTVVGLAESHISVHTWPERSVVQLDVFLCNYMHDNTEKCQRIFDAIVSYFGAKRVEAQYVERQ